MRRKSLSMLPSQFVSDGQHADAAWNELRPALHDEVRRLTEIKALSALPGSTLSPD
jgi:hypothetical protein